MKALLAVLLLAALGAGWHFREKLPPVLSLLPGQASRAASAAAPVPTPAPAAPEPSASLAGAPLAPAVGTAPVHPAAAPLVAPPVAAAALAQAVGESQRRAVAQHPALGKANSELNSRFVFRYKALKARNDPRLQQPDWPERLAEECAAEMRPASVKPSVFSTGGKVAQSR